MFQKVYQPGSLGLFLLACTAFSISFAISYGWSQRSGAGVQPAASLVPLGSDKDQDGLSGPVNRVRTETARLSMKSGKAVEGRRELLESTTYDPQGKRVDNSYFLVSSNSQVGKEEYVYDDKGNVREMIVRDDHNNILSKELYAYEYDGVGNWVKMTTSTLVYEGGKVVSQPTEVTYRNISYYFDQAIAEIVKPDSPATANLSDEERAEAELASLRSALEGWTAAINARDLDGLMRFYGSTMDAFYRARNVSQAFVRADRQRLFQRADAIQMTIGEPEINMNRKDGTPTMTFRKGYVVRVEGREHHGEVIQQLQWRRTDEGWKIVSERDIKVLRQD
jgi:ketosteroid isomerase-like protein